MMRSARDRLLRRMRREGSTPRGLHAATLLGALTLARADCEDYDNNCAVCVTETSWGLDCDFCWSDGTCRAVHTNCAREVAHDGSCTVTCSAGQFNVGGSCQQCQGGRYIEDGASGLTECRLCPMGQYVLDAGATDCIPCVPGKYSHIAGGLGCIECDAGQYNAPPYAPYAGAVACIPCEVGRFQFNTTLCHDCPAGTYAASEGGTSEVEACVDCPAGQYTRSAASSLCLNCAAGTFAPEPRVRPSFPCFLRKAA